MSQKVILCVVSATLLINVLMIKDRYAYNTGCVHPDERTIQPQTLSQDLTAKFEVGYTDFRDTNFHEYLRKEWLIPPSDGPLNLTNPDISDYSQAGQSSVVDQLLHGKENGFFIECGAAKGEQFSNSLFFEKERSWTGLLVEPNPNSFQELLTKKRHAWAVNGCLGTSNSTTRLGFEGDNWIGKTTENKGKYTVQCFPLHAILYSLGISHVDYFSLDVEGVELDILKTIPFDQITIDVFTVEYGRQDGLSEHVLSGLRKFFQDLGNYEEVRLLKPLDVIFQRIR